MIDGYLMFIWLIIGLMFAFGMFLIMRIDKKRHSKVKNELDDILGEIKGRLETELGAIEIEIIEKVEPKLDLIMNRLEAIEKKLDS